MKLNISQNLQKPGQCNSYPTSIDEFENIGLVGLQRCQMRPLTPLIRTIL